MPQFTVCYYETVQVSHEIEAPTLEDAIVLSKSTVDIDANVSRTSLGFCGGTEPEMVLDEAGAYVYGGK